MSYVETVCPRDCYDTCFMRFLLGKDGRPTEILGDETNPVTQGFLCPRGVADIRRAYSKERVLYPHLRVGVKPDGPFKRVSWEDALAILAKRIGSVLDESGPESALHLDYSGNMGLLTMDLPQRLFYALGFTKTDDTVCSHSGHDGLSLHYGLSYGVDIDELPDMKLIVYWGFNAAISAPHIYALTSRIRERGGTIVAVDPRKSETASVADLWIRPKPGSDVALAYGVMKHLLGNNLLDYEFLQKYSLGFDKLRDELDRWTPSLLEEFTGVDFGIIVKLAELYGALKPSVTMIGIGMQKSLCGAESVRAVSMIPALIGLHRGFFYTNSNAWNIDTSYLTGESLTDRRIKVVSQVALGRHLKAREFKLIHIYNTNPAVTLPNSQAIMEGFDRDDVFVVVQDTHWTETARHADLVLPAATFLEKEDLVVSYSHGHVRKSSQVMKPLGESRTELWVAAELARRLGLREEWLKEDPWKAIERALGNAFQNGNFSDLMAGRAVKLKMKPRDKYQTPTNKIELFATMAEEVGMTPLPRQAPPLRESGFILLSTAIAKYTHTQFQDVYGPLPPTVVINSEDARSLFIRDSDVVYLSNESGSIELRAAVSDLVPRGVVWSPRQCKALNGIPQNTITSDSIQPLGGGSTFNTTVVKLRRKLAQ